jgi:uncharacterized protein YdeI (YjbR/CyaY-like superfamily)
VWSPKLASKREESSMTDAVFFETAEALRAWLEQNHAGAGELWVGFHKKASGRPSVTYSEALDEALCFGWIDGVRRAVDGDRYEQRFTPRRPGSKWSAVNVRRVEALTKAGRMRPAGVAAYEAGKENGTQYANERSEAALDPEYEARLRANDAAWAFWEAQPASYRRAVAAWVMDAKQESTRLRRLEALISDSEAGEWVAPMRFARRKG